MTPPPPRDEPDSHRMPLEVRALARSLDFKIPVWAIFGAFLTGTYMAISMYLQVGQLVASVVELNNTMKNVSDKLNAASIIQAQTTGQIDLIHDRLQRLEQDHARMFAAHAALQRPHEK
jgi:hypothetical protein